MKFGVAAFLLFLTTIAATSAATLTSVSTLAFGPRNVLFAADWRAGRVYAFRLSSPKSGASRPFNLMDLQQKLVSVTGSSRLRIRGFAMRPSSNEAYLSLETGTRGEPAIVRVTPEGSVTKLDLAGVPHSSTQLAKTGGNVTFWNSIPERAYTVTDMKWHDGRLFVAGLANQDFSSTLRILSYPFRDASIASIEMYHTVHNQLETRAPIRAMTFAMVNGTDTLLAGYLCSPVVAIPVARLVDGAHVRAKTLGELGVAGIPTSMIAYDQPDMSSGKTFPFILVNERFRPAIAIPLAGIAKIAAGPGLSSPPPIMAPAGANLGAVVESFGGVSFIDNQNQNFFVAFRRDLDTGVPQVVSIDKRASFRLSDADVSDYDFPTYRYRGPFQTKYILPLQNMLKAEEGFPNLVIPTPSP